MRTRLLPLMALVVLSGCAAPVEEPVFLAPGHEAAPAPTRLLVLPFNVHTSLPDSLLDAAETTDDILHELLREAGHDVERLKLSHSQRAWRKAVNSIGGLDPANPETVREGIRTATSIMARDLAEERSFDAVVVPVLLVREAATAQRIGRWDHTRQPVRFTQNGREVYQVEDMMMRGRTRAISIRLSAFDPAGTRVFERTQGLELLDEAIVEGRYYRILPRTDLCTDLEWVRSRTRLAFSPWLALPGPADTR